MKIPTLPPTIPGTYANAALEPVFTALFSTAAIFARYTLSVDPCLKSAACVVRFSMKRLGVAGSALFARLANLECRCGFHGTPGREVS